MSNEVAEKINETLLPDEVSITARLRTLKRSVSHVTTKMSLKMSLLGESLAAVDKMTDVSVTIDALLTVGTQTWYSSTTGSASPSDLS